MIKILEYSKETLEEVFDRTPTTASVSDKVEDIIDDVIINGDEALFRYALKFDKAELTSLEVTKDEIDEALGLVEPEFLDILERAAKNIREYHSRQKREGFEIKGEDGRIIGQRVSPIEKVGIYVPGGTAAYPSTVLMDTIPAVIAGCEQIIMMTPPNKEGKINPYILAAAKVAGVHRIFKSGGAQAIAALAYGTKSVPNVYKIVGPGNAFVAEAKRQVFGMVSIDMIAGPSEILVVADESANPRYLAADLLSQAEHDKMATAVLVTNSRPLAEKVQSEIENILETLERKEIARASIDNNSKIIVADNLETVIDISNEIAPEHLEICLEEPFMWLDKIKNAGSVFLGNHTPEAMGDYYAGPNHTLPTSGTAKFSSPLSVDDFIKKSQYCYYTEDALSKVWKDVDCFAKKEGLTAHALSVSVRNEK